MQHHISDDNDETLTRIFDQYYFETLTVSNSCDWFNARHVMCRNKQYCLVSSAQSHICLLYTSDAADE